MRWIVLLLIGCGEDKGGNGGDDSAEPAAWRPDVVCPGDDGCETADGALMAGAAAVSITPPCFETWEDLDANGEWDDDLEAYYDCGCDRLCPEDEGYTAPDEGEADGDFQAAWLAGFHNARPASGVRDDLWARALVLERGETRIGIVAVDLVGWFYGDVALTRQEAASAGLDLDYVLVTSTHNHEGPDTMGLWGKTETSGGYDPTYAAFVRTASVQALQAAISDMREVGSLTVGAVDISAYHESGTGILVRDARDPVVIDELLGAALLRDAAGETIASIAHFGNHPEAMADENTLITSDFPNGLRAGLEGGVTYPASGYERAGYGGTAIFLNGTVGGMMTPLGVTVVDREGTEWRDYTFDRLDAMGKVMAEMAMDAIDGGQLVDPADLDLAAAAHVFRIPIDNYGFQAMFISGILEREVYDYDPTEPIDEGNVPWIETEMAWLKLGPLQMLTVPGELLPELAIGGYDGSHVNNPSDALIDPENPNPPDVSAAPAGPYLKDLVEADHRWILGMGNDELGYFVPEYDFELHPDIPWFEEAEGDHYEETNSLGPQTAGIIDEKAGMLMGWVNER